MLTIHFLMKRYQGAGGWWLMLIVNCCDGEGVTGLNNNAENDINDTGPWTSPGYKPEILGSAAIKELLKCFILVKNFYVCLFIHVSKTPCVMVLGFISFISVKKPFWMRDCKVWTLKDGWWIRINEGRGNFSRQQYDIHFPNNSSDVSDTLTLAPGSWHQEEFLLFM